MTARLFIALSRADSTLEEIQRKARADERKAILTLLDELIDDTRSDTAKRALRLAKRWIRVTA